jgi:stage II sporulation protein D
MSGVELQSKVGRAVGWHELRSHAPEVDEEGGEVRFRGRGLGHGVGMCQWGRPALAARGAGYREILGRYFPGARIDR